MNTKRWKAIEKDNEAEEERRNDIKKYKDKEKNLKKESKKERKVTT
jgi:hypothetical protein